MSRIAVGSGTQKFLGIVPYQLAPSYGKGGRAGAELFELAPRWSCLNPTSPFQNRWTHREGDGLSPSSVLVGHTWQLGQTAYKHALARMSTPPKLAELNSAFGNTKQGCPMKIRGFIPLNKALTQIMRLIRLRLRWPVKTRHETRFASSDNELPPYWLPEIVRLLRLRLESRSNIVHAMRCAILKDHLQIFWVPEIAYKRFGKVYHGDEVTEAEAYLFEQDAVAGEAFIYSTISPDPYSVLQFPGRDQKIVVERADLRKWLATLATRDLLAPMPLHAHDTSSRYKTTRYRQFQKQSYIPLSEALTWAHQRIALSAQQIVDAADFDQDVAETDRSRAEVLNRLIDFGLNGQLRMQGRPFSNGDYEALRDYQCLQDSDLLDFGRFDVECDGLLPGSGIAWSEVEVVSEAQRLRSDGFSDVLVKSEDLLKIFPEKRSQKKTTDTEEAERWLLDAFANDPDRNWTKKNLRKAFLAASPSFSAPMFKGLWDLHADPERRRVGRRKSTEKQSS